MFPWRAALVALLTSSSLSCSSTGSGASSSGASGTSVSASNQPKPAVLFSPAVTNVVVEVDYGGAGAAPYVALDKFGNLWSLFNANMFALFDGKKQITYPSTLADMELLDDVVAKDYSSKELLAIAAKHRNEISSGDTVTYYVLFVDGFFVDADGAQQPDVLGTSIADSGVVAMFKPAIAATQNGQKYVVAQFAEQTTLLHEMGHAVGFVNNGVPVNSAHQDTDHGNHCTNPKCVMSWDTDATAGGTSFAQSYVSRNDVVLFGQECLSDARILETKGAAK